MTVTLAPTQNPFTDLDPDCREIWEMLMQQDIEIAGDRAAAHKKFCGKALTVQGDEIVLLQ